MAFSNRGIHMTKLTRHTIVRSATWTFAAGAAAFVLAALTAPATEAHKAITSKFTYNDHIYPILKERCARCHYEGGPTSMSLMTYQSAVPWAESMREQLVGQKMPPWYADPSGPAVKGGHMLTTKELDTLVTWAVGGAPQGALGTDPPPYTPPAVQWHAGKPDLELQMPEAHTLKAGVLEDIKDFVIPTGLKQDTWIRAVDLLPGTPSMVRDAIVSLEDGTVLAAWVPGHEAHATPSGTAFKIPAGGSLKLQVHYKKHYLDEQNDTSDQTTVGLYVTEAPLSGRALQSMSVEGPQSEADSLEPRTFSAPLKTAGRIVALRPSFDQAYESVTIQAVVGERKVPLLKLSAAQPQWYRRYWLVEPIEIPAGATIEVTAKPMLDEFAAITQRKYPLQVALDYAPQ